MGSAAAFDSPRLGRDAIRASSASISPLCFPQQRKRAALILLRHRPDIAQPPWFARLVRCKCRRNVLAKRRQHGGKGARASRGDVAPVRQSRIERQNAALLADPGMEPDRGFTLDRSQLFRVNLFVLDARLVVLARAMSRNDHLAGTNRRQGSMPTFKDVATTRNEEVVSRVEPAVAEMRPLDRSSVGDGFLILLAGAQLGHMARGVVEDRPDRLVDTADRTLRLRRAPF